MLLVGVQNCTDTMENRWQFLTKFYVYLIDVPEKLLLVIFPREIKTYVHTKTCS